MGLFSLVHLMALALCSPSSADVAHHGTPDILGAEPVLTSVHAGRKATRPLMRIREGGQRAHRAWKRARAAGTSR